MTQEEKPLADRIQAIVLSSLDSHSTIDNTGSLKLDSGDSIDQLSILGVLNSLKSREVGSLLLHS